MKTNWLKCCLSVLALALAIGLGQKNAAMAQCLSYSGPNGNVLTSFIDIYPNYPSSDAYFNTLVQTANQPLPLGTYLTWCVDANTFIDPSQNYTVPGTTYIGTLIPDCDPNLNTKLPPNHPASCYVAPQVWQEVNYLLNHKNNAYFWDIQVAINNLVGGPPQGPSPPYPPFDTTVVNALLSAAASNAPTWTPTCGSVLGSVYVITNQAGATLTSPVQLLLLEVPYAPITFSNTPPSTNLGCNPLPSSIPTATNPVNTNLVSAYSCSGAPVTITASQTNSTNGCTTTRVITYTATDGYANSATYVQTITWTTDTTAPVIVSSPANTDLGCNPSTLPTVSSVKALVTATDTCSTPTINVTSADSGTPCGMCRKFTITVSDLCSNVSAPKYVTYTWRVDTNKPVIVSYPTNAYLGCNPSAAKLPTDASIAAQVVATDNCTVVSTNVAHVDGTNNCSAFRIFLITVNDECANFSDIKFVTNTWTVDTNGPVVTCPPDYTVSNTTPSGCVSFNPWDYSAPCTGGNPASFLTNCWSKVYTNGWTFCGVTDNSGYCAKFTSAGCVEKFLTCSNPPSCLKTNYTNPTTCEAGWLASHTTCLKLNVDLSDCSSKSGYGAGFGDLIYCDNTSPLNGCKVRDILNICHKAVAGCDVSSNKCGISDLTTVCSNLNQSFCWWNPSAWCSNHLVSPTITNVPPTVSGYATAADKCGGTPTITYSDVISTGACSGTYVIQRTWTAVDGCGNSNSCTQNIFIGQSRGSSISGKVYSDPYGTCLLTPICNQSGVSGVKVTLATSNNVVITTTVSDSNGNYAFSNLLAGTYLVSIATPTNCVQTAGTHCVHWVDATNRQCWFENDGYAHCRDANSNECWVASDGCLHHKTCNNQDCWTDKSNVCHTQNCTYVSCDVPKNNVETVTLGSCDADNCVNFAYCGGAPKVCVGVCGSTSCCQWWNPVTYYCSVTNCGNTCLNGCVLKACGQTINCPTLNPGQCCTIPVNYQNTCFNWNQCSWYNGNCYNTYTCQHTVTCTAPVINTQCSASASCTTYFSAW